MSIDGLSTLDGLAAFLESEVTDAVPAHLRGEVRAAAKLIRTCGIELAVRQREVEGEIDDLLTLCAAAVSDAELAELAALRTRAREPRMSLPEQDDLRGEVYELTTRTMVRLVAADDPLLTRFLRCLGTHAERRAPWQAVFDIDVAGVRL
ncbi:MAG: hypothetical protein ACT4PP_07215 [Sporichthyaceae bacterium]